MIKDRKKDIVWMVLLIFAFVLSIYKARYGSGKSDEAFYVELAYRLYQGDALFVDEQHLAQLFSFLLYPIISMYMMINSSLEGIVIFFRYLYAFLQLLVSIFIYSRLKEKYGIGAIFSSIIYLLYCPFNLMALSYNTLCIMCLTVSLIILNTYKNKYELLISGFLYAASVLCNPFLAIIFFVYALIIVGFKKNRIYIKQLISFTAGISILAVMFIVFCLSRSSIGDIIASIPNIFADDHDYSAGLVAIFANFTEEFIWFSKYTILVYMVYCALIFVSIIDYKNKYNKAINILLCINTIVYMLVVSLGDRNVNLSIFPINVLFVILMIKNKDLISHKDLLLYLIPSIAYIFCIYYSSDTGVHAASSASIVSLVITIPSIISYKWNSKINKLFFIFISIVLTLVQVYYRSLFVFNGEPISSQNYIIESGSHKYIHVNGDFFNRYINCQNDLDTITNKYKQRNLLIVSDNIFAYLLADDFLICTPSTWKTTKSEIEKSIASFNSYYKNNSNKIPNIVYIENKYLDVFNEFDIAKDYRLDSLNDDYSILVKE